MDERIVVAPDVAEVLLDIAKDPRASLFRLDLATPLADPSLMPDPVSPVAAGRTAAERELLRRYRIEVAKLLADAFRRKTYASAKSSSIYPRIGKDPADPGPRARRLSSGMVGVEHEPVADLLRGLAEGTAEDRAGFVELAIAAVGLDPSDSHRVQLAIAMQLEGRLEDCAQSLRQLAHSIARRHLRACAWGNLGLTRSLQGRSREAMVMYGRALSRDPEDVTFAAGLVTTALDCGDETTCRLACRHLELIADRDLPELIAIVRANLARKKASELSIAATWTTVLQRIEGDLGPTTGWMIHEILES